MQRVLFHSTIFGPIHSRRLGVSLGVNLTPDDGKVCSFDCLYCEAGFNAQGTGTTGLPSRDKVRHDLESRLSQMSAADEPLDVITFSGNGEPTLHPDFLGIIDDTLALRDRYYPRAKVSVLSNATQLHKPQVVEALRKVDNNILKLDSAIDTTVKILDRPTNPRYTVADVISGMKQFSGQCIIQTMILRGEYDGASIDNTTDAEVSALVEAALEVQPREVMLYSIDRKTPAENLHRVDHDHLEAIAEKYRSKGIAVQVV